MIEELSWVLISAVAGISAVLFWNFVSRIKPNITLAIKDNVKNVINIKGAAGSELVEDSQPGASVEVLFGTNRNLVEKEGTQETPKSINFDFSKQKAQKLSLGVTEISIPTKKHVAGKIERPGIFSLITGESKERHFVLQSANLLNKTNFVDRVRSYDFESANFKHSAMVFIHGFTTKPKDALFRTAQLKFDLQFDGPAFTFIWPTSNNYLRDIDVARASAVSLGQLIQIIDSIPGINQINIIAHSLGNTALVELFSRAETTFKSESTTIKQIILAAPDIDKDIFDQVSENFERKRATATIYASSNDRALMVSRKFREGLTRVGEIVNGNAVVCSGIDTIDISAVGTRWFSWNHSSYAESRFLMDDIAGLFSTGLRPPDKRSPILRKIHQADQIFWRVPKSKSG
ncbi:MAG: alpha/beta hydrolase [Pseudomonadota bacterium]